MATGDVRSEQADRSRDALGIEPCPDKPCKFCVGNSAVVKSRDENYKPTYMTSWEWCRRFNACGSTIDWELVFHGR